MRIGPKYKIARRLGAPVFEKTQTPKYALSLARKEKSSKAGRGRPKSAFGLELVEKQKARFTYGLSERQFRVYVEKARKRQEPVQALFSLLESRLDNVLYRAGFAKTRFAAHQMAGHGHITVNGKRVTIPSIHLRAGDVVGIRVASSISPLFAEVDKRMKEISTPTWLVADPLAKTVKVVEKPIYLPQEHIFDLGTVIEFYNR